jgi:putative tricarboxylic transport membrane protein
MTAALGGHVDVWAGTLAGVLPHVQSNAVRVFGISAPERQAGAAATLPTLREQGVDAVYYGWRGFIAPGGLSPAQISFWDQAFRSVVNEDEWKKITVENVWGDDYKNPAQTRKHLDAEFVLLQKMLADLGVTAKTLGDKRE